MLLFVADVTFDIYGFTFHLLKLTQNLLRTLIILNPPGFEVRIRSTLNLVRYSFKRGTARPRRARVRACRVLLSYENRGFFEISEHTLQVIKLMVSIRLARLGSQWARSPLMLQPRQPYTYRYFEYFFFLRFVAQYGSTW